MLEKSSIFMMLLIVTAVAVAVAVASLAGISSSIIYKPANVQAQKPLGTGVKPLITQKQVETLNQAMADKQLLDRIFPQIVKRIDGRTLAAKVLPYLDLKVVLTQRPGEYVTNYYSKAAEHASCPPGETAVSAGFTNDLRTNDLYMNQPKPTGQSIDTFQRNSQYPNIWNIRTSIPGAGSLFTYAECLTIKPVLKDVQQQQQAKQ